MRYLGKQTVRIARGVLQAGHRQAGQRPDRNPRRRDPRDVRGTAGQGLAPLLTWQNIAKHCQALIRVASYLPAPLTAPGPSETRAGASLKIGIGLHLSGEAPGVGPRAERPAMPLAPGSRPDFTPALALTAYALVTPSLGTLKAVA